MRRDHTRPTVNKNLGLQFKICLFVSAAAVALCFSRRVSGSYQAGPFLGHQIDLTADPSPSSEHGSWCQWPLWRRHWWWPQGHRSLRCGLPPTSWRHRCIVQNRSRLQHCHRGRRPSSGRRPETAWLFGVEGQTWQQRFVARPWPLDLAAFCYRLQECSVV